MGETVAYEALLPATRVPVGQMADIGHPAVVMEFDEPDLEFLASIFGHMDSHETSGMSLVSTFADEFQAALEEVRELKEKLKAQEEQESFSNAVQAGKALYDAACIFIETGGSHIAHDHLMKTLSQVAEVLG